MDLVKVLHLIHNVVVGVEVMEIMVKEENGFQICNPIWIVVLLQVLANHMAATLKVRLKKVREEEVIKSKGLQDTVEALFGCKQMNWI